MAVLSKNTTYSQLIDQIRIESGIYDSVMYPDDYLIKEIDYAISNFYAKNAGRSFYQQRATYSLSGSANPYSVDLNTTLPFPYKIIDVVYKNSGRISIKQVSKQELEELTQLTAINSNSIYCSIGGDTIDIVFGSDVTVVSLNTIEVLYQRQPILFKNFLIDRNNSLSKGLIAYYKCEDGTDSYNDYDGTASGITFTAGKVNNGINFGTAANSCLDLGNNTIFDFERTDPWTICFWSKIDTLSHFRQFLGRHLGSPTQRGWQIWQSSTNNRIVAQLNNDDGTNYIQVTTPYTSLLWTDFVITYDGSSLKTGIEIYANTVKQSVARTSSTLTGTIKIGSAANALIGNRSGTNGNFQGMKDEISIYNRMLSQTEIEDRYNNGDGQTLIQNIKTTSYLDILDCDIPFIANNLVKNIRMN